MIYTVTRKLQSSATGATIWLAHDEWHRPYFVKNPTHVPHNFYDLSLIMWTMNVSDILLTGILSPNVAFLCHDIDGARRSLEVAIVAVRIIQKTVRDNMSTVWSSYCTLYGISNRRPIPRSRCNRDIPWLPVKRSSIMLPRIRMTPFFPAIKTSTPWKNAHWNQREIIRCSHEKICRQ